MADHPVRSRRDASAMEERRLAALPRLRRGESLSSIARKLGVSRQAVFVWAERWRRRGENGLHRRPRPGRPTKLAHTRLAQLPHLLAQGAEPCGGQFVIPGLGKPVKTNRKARAGRNPQTIEANNIPTKTVVKFRLAKAFKDAVVPPKKK